MSAPIKVRAWDKKNKRMLYLGSLSAVGDFYRTKFNEKGILDETSFADFYERFMLDFEWNQSTNKESLNHKTVFVNDIVKDDTNIAVVRFGEYQANNNRMYNNEVAYGFYLEFLSGVIDHATNLDDYEVIGNIYENPELLSN